MKTLDKALSLANKVQHTHEELCFRLEKVESELATFGAQEPVGEQLTQVQERQKVSTLLQLRKRPVAEKGREARSDWV